MASLWYDNPDCVLEAVSYFLRPGIRGMSREQRAEEGEPPPMGRKQGGGGGAKLSC